MVRLATGESRGVWAASWVFRTHRFDPQFGARPLKRLIQKQIINELSKKLLGGTIDRAQPVLVDVFDGTVVFRNDIPAATEKRSKEKTT